MAGGKWLPQVNKEFLLDGMSLFFSCIISYSCKEISLFFLVK